MVDSQTKSLWSHLLGRAMRGPLKDAELEMLPSVITDWKSWRDEHAETTVLKLSRTSNDYRREFYRDPSKFVLGLVSGENARAWSFDQLIKQPVVNDQFDDEPILIAFSIASSTAYAYRRRLEERTLTFRAVDNHLVDEQTRSHWNPASGVTVAGPLTGKRLSQALGVVSYRQAWKNFHPRSSYWIANS